MYTFFITLASVYVVPVVEWRPCRLANLSLSHQFPVLPLSRSDGADTYDCFVYTYGPLGYDKCKYIGSTDIDCFETEPVTLEDTSGGEVVDPFTGNEAYALVLDYATANLGSPAIGSGAVDAIGFACVEGTGGAVTCPSATLGDAVLTIAYPDYANDVLVGDTTFTTGTNTGTGGDPVVPNTAYTCYSLIEDTCDAAADPICSEPIELVSVGTLAVAQVNSDLFSQVADGSSSVQVNCVRDPNENDGDAEVVTNWWSCVVDQAPVWYPVTCNGDASASHPIPGFEATLDTATCVLWQGQGPADSGCSPYFEEGCTWFASGTDSGDYSAWYLQVSYVAPP